MALKKIDMGDGKYLYRCESCGFESPYSPVKEHELGPSPPHRCNVSAATPEEDDDIHF
jgi:hypothetical protein